MHNRVYWFTTRSFVDSEAEAAERVNDNIGGFALATWLSRALQDKGVTASGPWQEDHGADFSIEHEGAKYVCVCAIEEDGKHDRDGHVEISAQRGLLSRVFGGKPASEPAIFKLVHDLLSSHDGVKDLRAE